VGPYLFYALVLGAPFLQLGLVKLNKRWSGPLIALLIVLPALLLAWCFIGWMWGLLHRYPPDRIDMAQFVVGPDVIVTLIVTGIMTIPYFAIWNHMREKTLVSWRNHNERVEAPNLSKPLWGSLVILLALTIYLVQRDSLADAVAANNVALARKRLAFNVAGLGPDNGIVGYISSGERYTEPLLPVAVKHGNREMVKLLLDHGAEINTQKLRPMGIHNTQNPLHYAIGQADKEMVELLLARGADPSPGIQPACAARHIELLDLLLRAGGEPSLGLVPAFQNYDVPLLEFLYEMGADPSCALARTESFDRSTLEYLLTQGAEPTGGVLLALKANDLELLEHLLILGANPNRGVIEAVKRHNSEALKRLLEFGANPNLGLDAAVAEFDASAFELLIEWGADQALARRALREHATNYAWSKRAMQAVLNDAAK